LKAEEICSPGISLSFFFLSMLQALFYPFSFLFDFAMLSGVFLSVAAQKYAMQV